MRAVEQQRQMSGSPGFLVLRPHWTASLVRALVSFLLDQGKWNMFLAAGFIKSYEISEIELFEVQL